MQKPNAETCALLRDLKTEIGAGEILRPLSQANRAHNRAIDKALCIIDLYMQGVELIPASDGAKSGVAPFGWIGGRLTRSITGASWKKG